MSIISARKSLIPVCLAALLPARRGRGPVAGRRRIIEGTVTDGRRRPARRAVTVKNQATGVVRET